MAYDTYQAERIERYFTQKGVDFFTKKMMGGLIFMVDEKMCIGLDQDKKTKTDRLMARVGSDFYEQALKEEHARKMDFTGGPMKGFVFVNAEGIDLDEDLEFWLEKALDFNPMAKKSPSKKKQIK